MFTKQEHIKRLEQELKIANIFSACVNEWCKLDISLIKAENIKRFKSMLNNFLNLKYQSLFAMHRVSYSSCIFIMYYYLLQQVIIKLYLDSYLVFINIKKMSSGGNRKTTKNTTKLQQENYKKHTK